MMLILFSLNGENELVRHVVVPFLMLKKVVIIRNCILALSNVLGISVSEELRDRHSRNHCY